MAEPTDGLIAPGRDLPRLAVVSDVPIVRTNGGPLLLYRLLKAYPADRLRVVTGWFSPLNVDVKSDRLEGVTYRDLPYRAPRAVRNRLNPFWPVAMTGLVRRKRREVEAALEGFDPEAILTVPHNYLWIAAADVARRRGLPLHLVVHDDWPSYQTFRRPGSIPRAVRGALRTVLGRVYRQAESRLCVSPGMVEHCRSWFGESGTLLYPNRGDDSPEPRLRVRPESGGPPVVAFCGHVNQDGTIELLRRLAEVLARLGGRLDLYTLVPDWLLEQCGLVAPTVRKVGFLPASELGDRVAETAHALFLPASFQPRERLDVATLFPSKLADYTTMGLPVLIWGPPDSSAARWALDHPGSAELIREPDPSAVRDAILRIVSDPAHARRLAETAMEAGTRSFGLESARGVLFERLAAPLAAGSTS